MRCISCGAELDGVRVDRDDITMVPGYERQTSQCSTCKEVEQRPVFRDENGLRPTKSVTAPSLVTSILADADKDLDESEALLRRAIEMVRGPVRGATPARKSTPGRVIAIRHDPSDEAAYAAKDVKSGLVVLRHRDVARLRAMCSRLGWQVVDADAPSADDRTKV
jgi:hypothetical protein